MSAIDAIDFLSRAVLIVLVLVMWWRMNEAERTLIDLAASSTTVAAVHVLFSKLLTEQNSAIERVELALEQAASAEPGPRLYGRDPDA